MKEIRARVRNGRIEPMEPLNGMEGEEVLVRVAPRARRRDTLLEALRATAGSWADLLDAEELKLGIYEDRSAGSRPQPRL